MVKKLFFILAGFFLMTMVVIADVSILNSATYLKLPSPYEASGQYVHPSILKFPEPWQGYQYWMAATPYPGGDSSKENPVILASNDGLNWELKTIVDQTGLTEPYSSDPCLVYDGQVLWIYWRYLGPIPALQRIYRASSENGIVWSEKEQVLEDERESMCSPSVLLVGGKWVMFYSDLDGRIYKRISDDGLAWGEKVPQQLFLVSNENFQFTTTKNTHLEVRLVKDGLTMIVMGDSMNHGKNLYLFSGFNDSPNWYGNGEPLLKISPGDWDGYSLYKPSFLIDEWIDGNISKSKLRLWYSAYRMNPVVFHIGYTESLMDSWSFSYNLANNPWKYQEEGLVFQGYPNANGEALLDKNIHNGSIQTELAFTEGAVNAGLIYRYKNGSNFAAFKLEGNKVKLTVQYNGKAEERVLELKEQVTTGKSYRLKLSVTNQVYKAYLNDKLVLSLISNLDLLTGFPGLTASGNTCSFKNFLLKSN